jgi:hypothetical protein
MIKTHLYTEKFENEIKIDSNNFIAKKIDLSLIENAYLENEYYQIIYSLDHTKPYVPTILIDIDYPDKSYYVIFNPLNQDFNVKKIDFLIDFIYKMDFINIINTNKLFIPVTINATTDKIKSLQISTKHANGIDIIFDKSYKIKPKETIKLNLQFKPNENLANYSKLYVMRSRFSRMGLCVSLISDNNIFLLNMSNKEILVGNKFIQIVLPNKYAFQLNENTLEEIFGQKNIEFIYLSNKIRKPKNLKYL